MTTADLKHAIAEFQTELDRRAPAIVAAALGDWAEMIHTQGTIAAIKEYRSIMGCGLKEAKDFIDTFGFAFVAAPQQKEPWSEVTVPIPHR